MIELREQLRKLRLEEDRGSKNLQKAKAKISALEQEISNIKENAMNELMKNGILVNNYD